MKMWNNWIKITLFKTDVRVKMVENSEFGTLKSRRTDSVNKVNEFEPDSVVLLWVWATTALPPWNTELRPFRSRLHTRGLHRVSRRYPTDDGHQIVQLALLRSLLWFVLSSSKTKRHRSSIATDRLLFSRNRSFPDQVISRHRFSCVKNQNPFWSS